MTEPIDSKETLDKITDNIIEDPNYRQQLISKLAPYFLEDELIIKIHTDQPSVQERVKTAYINILELYSRNELARNLRISRTTLWRKLSKLEVPNPKARKLKKYH